MKHILSFSLIFFPFSICMAGSGWSGNGGGSAKEQDNIWFLGTSPIPYCIIRDQNFPATAALQQMIIRNSQKWLSFFQRYSLDKALSFYSASKIQFPDEMNRNMTLQYQPSENCSEVEKFCSPTSLASNPDSCHEILRNKILFLFGKPNIVVENYLKLNGDVPALALRTDYNHQAYRSGGIVWIPNYRGSWSGTAHLLLHEMGHVYGMKHDSCWVMSRKAGEITNVWNGLGRLEQIEAPNWPYSFKTNDLIYFTDQRIKIDGTLEGYFPNAFLGEAKNLLGFAPLNYFQMRGLILRADRNSIEIRIEIQEHPTGIQHELTGILQSKNYVLEPLMTPQIFTLWKKRRSSSEGNIRESLTRENFFLDNGWVAEDLQGVLSWNGKKIGATLSRRQGLTLSLLFPDTYSWMTLSTVQF